MTDKVVTNKIKEKQIFNNDNKIAMDPMKMMHRVVSKFSVRNLLLKFRLYT